jgi:hypothetical protein
MKNLNKVLLAAAVAATVGLATNASAQYKAVGNDGIAASPKLRQMLDERAASHHVAPQTHTVGVRYRSPAAGVTASPKVLHILDSQKVVLDGGASKDTALAGYRPVGADGIAASPKLRSQLDERSPRFAVAPVK